ncbi:hypothetical protein [Roseiconus lacunae]|uniref:hypothetical protein n=1 Tax=Roseiconus lacunae TaxID=2605694 RepID=UPI001E3AA9E6|nr:hypothetical protein [Roseiconus lacunae]MCD0462542.1 hypothetical protein [Roseiconus lacunae]
MKETMRLKTDAVISVFASAPKSIARAYHCAKEIHPNLTLGDFRSKIDGKSSLFFINFYRNEIEKFLENIESSTTKLKMLHEQVADLNLIDAFGRSVAIDDLEETLRFHESYQPGDVASEFGPYLEIFEAADWLAHAGEGSTNDLITSVEEPPQNETTWVYVQVALQNRFVKQLVEQAGYHHGCLQAYYDRLMPWVTKLTREKLKAAPAGFFDDRNDPSGLIMLSLIERRFASILSSTVAVEWAQWLVHGHIPCGWSGAFPEGKLLVW